MIVHIETNVNNGLSSVSWKLK